VKHPAYQIITLARRLLLDVAFVSGAGLVPGIRHSQKKGTSYG
jgi:hypothetical protein